MNCHECALAGKTTTAVSICPHCGVGLCLEHLREAQAYRVGGTTYGCPHQPVRPSRSRRHAAAAATGRESDARVPTPSTR